MCFAEADSAKEDDIGFILYELKAEEVLQGGTIDCGRPAPFELFKL